MGGNAVGDGKSLLFYRPSSGKVALARERMGSALYRVKSAHHGFAARCLSTGMPALYHRYGRGIDTYCCEAVLRLRKEWDDVVLEAAIPCRTQAQRWKARDQERYRRLLAQCDLKTLIQPNYTPGCMLRRDRYMVQRADYVIGVYDGSSQGGTRRPWPMRWGRSVKFGVINLDDFLE